MKNKAKYLQIEEDIRSRILSRRLAPGQQISTEEQLCQEYGVSRMTINKAISGLVAGGYVYRIPGKGTFVRHPHAAKSIGSGRSFTQDMQALGLKPGSRLLEYRIIWASEDPRVRELMGLSDGDLLHYFTRLRTGDGLPIALSCTYIPCSVLPSMDVSRLETSLYDYLDALGVGRSYSEGEMTAQNPTPEQRRILGIGGEALLVNSHITYSSGGAPVEYTSTYYIGSRYSYSYTSHLGR